MATLRRVDGSHGYGTRSPRSGLMVRSGNHRLVAYRVPAKWRTLTEKQRGMRSVEVFKRSSKRDFLVQYELFQCRVPGCWVCGDHSAGDRDLEGWEMGLLTSFYEQRMAVYYVRAKMFFSFFFFFF
jgi:hypothetical protein